MLKLRVLILHEIYKCLLFLQFSQMVVLLRVPMLFGNLGNIWELDLGHS